MGGKVRARVGDPGSLQGRGLRTILQILEFKSQNAVILTIRYLLQGFRLSSLKCLLELRLRDWRMYLTQ